MSNIKIGIAKWGSTTSYFEETDVPASGGKTIVRYDYQILRLKLYIADAESNVPTGNLQLNDVKTNFLINTHDSTMFEVSLSYQSNSKPVHLARIGSVYYLTVWQLINITHTFVASGGAADFPTYFPFPADWLEIIINSTTINASGNALYYLH